MSTEETKQITVTESAPVDVDNAELEKVVTASEEIVNSGDDDTKVEPMAPSNEDEQPIVENQPVDETPEAVEVEGEKSEVVEPSSSDDLKKSANEEHPNRFVKLFHKFNETPKSKKVEDSTEEQSGKPKKFFKRLSLSGKPKKATSSDEEEVDESVAAAVEPTTEAEVVNPVADTEEVAVEPEQEVAVDAEEAKPEPIKESKNFFKRMSFSGSKPKAVTSSDEALAESTPNVEEPTVVAPSEEHAPVDAAAEVETAETEEVAQDESKIEPKDEPTKEKKNLFQKMSFVGSKSKHTTPHEEELSDEPVTAPKTDASPEQPVEIENEEALKESNGPEKAKITEHEKIKPKKEAFNKRLSKIFLDKKSTPTETEESGEIEPTTEPEIEINPNDEHNNIPNDSTPNTTPDTPMTTEPNEVSTNASETKTATTTTSKKSNQPGLFKRALAKFKQEKAAFGSSSKRHTSTPAAAPVSATEAANEAEIPSEKEVGTSVEEPQAAAASPEIVESAVETPVVEPRVVQAN